MKDIIMIILCIISLASVIFVAISDSIRSGVYTAIVLGCCLSVLDAIITHTNKN